MNLSYASNQDGLDNDSKSPNSLHYAFTLALGLAIEIATV